MINVVCNDVILCCVVSCNSVFAYIAYVASPFTYYIRPLFLNNNNDIIGCFTNNKSYFMRVCFAPENVRFLSK